MEKFAELIKAINSLELKPENLFLLATVLIFVLARLDRIITANRDLIGYAEKVLPNQKTVEECIEELNQFKKFLAKDKALNTEWFLSNEIIINKAICRLIVKGDKHPSHWKRRLEYSADYITGKMTGDAIGVKFICQHFLYPGLYCL